MMAVEALRAHLKKYETRTILKKELLGRISLEQARLDKLEDSDIDQAEELKKLKEKLENLKNSLDGQFKNEDEAARAIDELSGLRRKIREAEFDGAQCRSRAKLVRDLMETLASAGVASYERELVRLGAKFEKSSSLPSEERMLELESIAEQLQRMLELKDLASQSDIGSLEENTFAPSSAGVSAAVSNPADDMETRRMVTEIRDWADRIAQIDASEGEKLRPVLEKLRTDTSFPDRLIQLRRQMKRTWGTLRERRVSTEFFRETLEELIETVQFSQRALETADGAELMRRYDALCGNERGEKFIERAEFMELYEDIARFVHEHEKEAADEYLIRKLGSALDEMGYELLPDELSKEPLDEGVFTASPGEVRYLESPYDGYRIMMKLESGALSVRLVRVAASEEEKNAPGADQRQKDIETGRKWCRDFDGFLERMSGLGLPLEMTVRKEPEDSPILVVIDKNRPAAKKRRRDREDASAGRALNSRKDEAK
jgi:hypothetical protein